MGDDILKAYDELWKGRLNDVYRERNQLVSFLSTQYDSFLFRHEAMEEGFKNLVVIQSPVGQMSWHITDSELGLFTHLIYRTDYVYDGHTTEEKYERLTKLGEL